MSSKLSLYLFDRTSISQQEVDALKNLLDPEQQKKCASINKRKQTEFILSRSLLSFAMRQYLQSDAIGNIKERSQLPPQLDLADQNNIQFNISHSQDMLGIAIGRNLGAVGFDLQIMKDFSNSPNFAQDGIESARFFCNESQLSILESSAESSLFASHYTQLWAQKEAYLKSLQCGINNALLKKTYFTDCSNQGAALSSTVFKKDPKNNYILAVYCKTPYRIVCQQLSFSQSEFKPTKPMAKLNWNLYDVHS